MNDSKLFLQPYQNYFSRLNISTKHQMHSQWSTSICSCVLHRLLKVSISKTEFLTPASHPQTCSSHNLPCFSSSKSMHVLSCPGQMWNHSLPHSLLHPLSSKRKILSLLSLNVLNPTLFIALTGTILAQAIIR